MGVPILFFILLRVMKQLPRIHIALFLILLLLALLSGQKLPSQAQTEAGVVRILQVDTSAFPSIKFTFLANSPDGGLFPALSEKDVFVQEDSLPAKNVETLQPVDAGIQVIVAYNLGPALSNSASNSGTRFQAVNAAIANWVGSQPQDSKDDFSLATNTGIQAIREQDAVKFSETLLNFQPDLGNNQPNLTSLLQSLDLATDPNPDPFMKRIILYVTPQLNVTNISALAGLIDRAVQQNVKIIIWLVAPATVESSNPTVVDPLKEMAVRTGGEFFLYSGDGSLPDPESYVRPMRNLFEATYRSSLNVKGTHRLTTSISRSGQTAVSDAYPFPLSILPPNLIILNPTFSITREWINNPQNPQEWILSPSLESIEYLVEFPDGFTRPLTFTRFYINGELAAEDTTQPFDQFVWDYSAIETSQNVELVLEVEDSLGLIEKSIPQNVQITVAEKPLTFWQSLVTFQLSTKRWILLGSVLATGAVLIFAITLAGKRRHFWRQQSAARERRTDPLTQPVAVRQEISRLANAAPTPYPIIKGQPVNAWLVPLNDHFEALRSKAIPLSRAELIIGRDSRQAELVIPSPAMAEVHAFLTRDNNGDFWLADNNSIAGTWVNYAPISTQGIRLQHGDLVHFAKNAYRFELTNPPPGREAQLITYNDDI